MSKFSVHQILKKMVEGKDDKKRLNFANPMAKLTFKSKLSRCQAKYGAATVDEFFREMKPWDPKVCFCQFIY